MLVYVVLVIILSFGFVFGGDFVVVVCVDWFWVLFTEFAEFG